MDELPLADRFGNRLLRIDDASDGRWSHRIDHVPVPATLVVVIHHRLVLLVFDTWRRRWELPGGSLEPGETWLQAGIRELDEETGIRDVALDPAALATFELVNPDRREQLAIYRTELEVLPSLRLNPEVSGFRWWSPLDPIGDDMSPLDATIARRVAGVPYRL